MFLARKQVNLEDLKRKAQEVQKEFEEVCHDVMASRCYTVLIYLPKEDVLEELVSNLGEKELSNTVVDNTFNFFGN